MTARGRSLSTPVFSTATATTLYSGQLVFRSARGADEQVRPHLGEVEGGEDVPGLDALGHLGLDLDAAVPAPHLDDVAARDPELLRVLGMDLEPVAREQLEVARAAGHRADVVVLEPPAGDEDERVLLARLVARRLVRQRREVRAAARGARTRSS